MSLRRLWLAAQVAVSVALLILLFRAFDFAAFAALFQRIPVWFYLASFLALAVGQLLYVWKWHIVLRTMGRRIAYPRLAEQHFIALFFNNFLPTSIGGDVFRIYYLGRREGYAAIGLSVFMDRVLGFFSLVVWATTLVWWLGITSPAFETARRVLTVLSAVFAVVGCAFLFVPPLPLISRLKRVPRLESIGALLARLVENAAPFRRKPYVVLPALALVLGYCVLLAWVYRAYFRLSAGQEVAYVPVLAALFTIGILSNLPITVNGIGLREQLHYLLFGALGLSKELAVGISLIVFSQLLLLSLAGCLLWLRMRALYILTGEARAG